jgi:hypothetical protein
VPPTALALALALSGPTPAQPADHRAPASPARAALPDLSLHLAVGGRSVGAAAGQGGGASQKPTLGGLPACSGDLCQAVVAVPGYELSYGSSRAARADAFVALLSHVHVEPFASVGRALVVSGVRVDYSPSSFEPQGSGAHGWGNVLLRVRLRLDADNGVVIPEAPR